MKKNLVRRVANRILAVLARMLPGATSLRPMLHRLRGVKIHGKVFIGDEVYLENEYPEAVELLEGAQICVRSVLLAHTRGVGKIVIGKDVFVGANCVIAAAPGKTLRIGDNAVIAASSVVSSDVPDNALIGQPKAVPVARVTVPLSLTGTYDDFLAGLKPWKK